ncbi:hypothetical protein B0A55_02079 [Friedmanniomyces simplex]|uniref:Uncharacterized protein n=1 Tax=Friedmanniomyces simplex TaxID=329884 RepID=A0A4U0XZC8_9PEZI|nr:hypothetical protein B0A55_02079 [Friedmanniomyces simplex]
MSFETYLVVPSVRLRALAAVWLHCFIVFEALEAAAFQRLHVTFSILFCSEPEGATGTTDAQGAAAATETGNASRSLSDDSGGEGPAARKRKAKDTGENDKGITRPAASATTRVHIIRGMGTDAARRAVLGTVELLEMILLQAPAETVFIAQCVRRLFRDTVATSVLLQQKLFQRLRTRRNGGSPRGKVGLLCVTEACFASLTSTISLLILPPPTEDETESGLWCGRLPLQDRMAVTGEGVDFQFKKARVVGAASWKLTYLTKLPCRVASMTGVWVIDAEPPLRGFLDIIPTTTTAAQGFTLGALLDISLQKPKYHQGYVYGEWEVIHAEPMIDFLTRLEREMGKEARLESMRVDMWDVVWPKAEEWEIFEG